MENMFFVSATIACIVFTLHILYSIYVINKQNKKINSYLKQDSEPMWKEIKVKTEQKKEEKKEKRHYNFSCQWIKTKGDTFYWKFYDKNLEKSNLGPYIGIKIQRTKWKDKTYFGRLNRLLNKNTEIISLCEYNNIKNHIIITNDNAEFFLKHFRKHFMEIK